MFGVQFFGWSNNGSSAPGGDISGSGTPGYIPVFTSSQVLGNSVINQTTSGNALTFTPSASASGAVTAFTFTNPANTNQTAGAEISGVKYGGGSRQWATGSILNYQREVYLTTTTYSAVGASIIPNAYGFYVEAPTPGANMTFTNKWAAGFLGNVENYGMLQLGDSNTSQIKLNNSQNGRQLQIDAATAGFNTFTLGLGSTGSATIFETSGPIFTMNKNLRFDTSAISNIYVNNGGLGLRLNGANDTSGTYAITISDAGLFGFSNPTPIATMDVLQRVVTTGAASGSIFTQSANTGQTLSTEIPGTKFVGGSRQWATGAITTQREHYWSTTTYTAVGASVITNAYGAYFEAPIASTNVTITNNWAAGFNAAILVPTISGSVSASGSLTLQSTSDVTKGSIFLGTGNDITRVQGQLAVTNANNIQNIFSVTSNLTASSGLGVSNLFSTNFYNGAATQHGVAFFNATTVSGQSTITQGNGLLTALYHSQAFTIPEWQGIETGGAFISGSAVVTNAWGISCHLPSCSTGGTVTNAAGVFIKAMANTGITNTYAIYSESVYNSVFGGAVTIGSTTPLTSSLVNLRVNKGTSFIEMGEVSSGIAAIWGNQTSQTSSNSAIQFNGSTITQIQSSQDLRFQISGTINYRIQASTQIFSPSAASSGASTTFTYTIPANTNQTLSTEISSEKYNGGSRQWATGAITTQRERYQTTTTYTAVGASVITNAYGMYIEAPTASTNVTITNNYVLGIPGNIDLSSGKIYFNQTAIDATNFALNGSQFATILNSSNQVFIRLGNGNEAIFNIGQNNFVPSARTSGALSSFLLTQPANTNQTLSTEIPGFKFLGGSRQWATGAIATQRETYFSTTTYTAIGASVITNAYGLYVEAPTASTNITITNNYSLGLNGNLALDINNAVIQGTLGNLIINANNGNLLLRSFGATVAAINTNTIAFSPVATSSGISTTFTVTNAAYTGQTLSTEIPGFKYVGGSRQWATGAITTQRETYFSTTTYTAVGASVITNAYGAYFEAPTASTNVTITNLYALGLAGGSLGLAAGTTTYAPLRFTSGTNLTTAVAGGMEYNGTNLFFTRTGTTREGVLTQSAVTTEVIVSDTSVTINIGGVTYKLLARA